MSDKELPAFPVSTIDGYTQYGATLRDYFAAKAPADLIGGACGTTAKYLVGRPMPEWKPYMDHDEESKAHFEIECVKWKIELLSKLNFMYADAMLEARK